MPTSSECKNVTNRHSVNVCVSPPISNKSRSRITTGTNRSFSRPPSSQDSILCRYEESEAARRKLLRARPPQRTSSLLTMQATTTGDSNHSTKVKPVISRTLEAKVGRDAGGVPARGRLRTPYDSTLPARLPSRGTSHMRTPPDKGASNLEKGSKRRSLVPAAKRVVQRPCQVTKRPIPSQAQLPDHRHWFAINSPERADPSDGYLPDHCNNNNNQIGDNQIHHKKRTLDTEQSQITYATAQEEESPRNASVLTPKPSNGNVLAPGKGFQCGDKIIRYDEQKAFDGAVEVILEPPAQDPRLTAGRISFGPQDEFLTPAQAPTHMIHNLRKLSPKDVVDTFEDARSCSTRMYAAILSGEDGREGRSVSLVTRSRRRSSKLADDVIAIGDNPREVVKEVFATSPVRSVTMCQSLAKKIESSPHTQSSDGDFKYESRRGSVRVSLKEAIGEDDAMSLKRVDTTSPQTFKSMSNFPCQSENEDESKIQKPTVQIWDSDISTPAGNSIKTPNNIGDRLIERWLITTDHLGKSKCTDSESVLLDLRDSRNPKVCDKRCTDLTQENVSLSQPRKFGLNEDWKVDQSSISWRQEAPYCSSGLRGRSPLRRIIPKKSSNTASDVGAMRRGVERKMNTKTKDLIDPETLLTLIIERVQPTASARPSVSMSKTPIKKPEEQIYDDHRTNDDHYGFDPQKRSISSREGVELMKRRNSLHAMNTHH